MENGQDEEYQLSERIYDVARILKFFEKALPPAIDYYEDKLRLKEVLQGVVAMSRVLQTLTDNAARECDELEEKYQKITENEHA